MIVLILSHLVFVLIPAVAVASSQNKLTQFVKALGKGKKDPNVTKLALHGMPSGSGKKGGTTTRKRKQKETVTDRVPWNLSHPEAGVTINVTGSSNNISDVQAVVTACSTIQQPYSTVAPHGASFTSSNSWMHPNWPSSAPFSPPFSPSSTQPDNQPFYLYLICGNISACQGCGNKFSKPTAAPYDLCLQHKEWRSFSVDNCPQTKFSPAYYHVSLFCVQRNWPMFHPASVVVTPEISIKLNEVHKDFLSSIGITVMLE